jgi:tRNA(Arg) A34 adenosine deaminase TadA
MCLGAIYWARPKIIYYGNTKEDAAKIGFDDSMIYEEMKAGISNRKIPGINISRRKANVAFDEWHQKEDKKIY